MHFFSNLYYVKKLLLLLLVIVVVIIYTKKYRYLSIPALCLGILIFFFRNNLTLSSFHKRYFLSPSSSTILTIEKAERYTTIKTFLSVFDRHFMIAPCDCTIVNIQRINDDRKKIAEQLRITFQNEYGEYFYLDQIVNRLGHSGQMLKLFYNYRTIVFYKIGKKLTQGERYGLIRFGSHMMYKIPNTYTLRVQSGQHIDIGKVLATHA